VLAAQMNFLHGEYAGLLVNSTFDPETAKVFKCLEKNTFAFRGTSLNNLRSAAEITAARSHVRPVETGPAYNSSWQGYRGSRGGRGYQQGNRGFGRRGSFGDPYRQFQRGSFNNFNQPQQRNGGSGNNISGDGD